MRKFKMLAVIVGITQKDKMKPLSLGLTISVIAVAGLAIAVVAYFASTPETTVSTPQLETPVKQQSY